LAAWIRVALASQGKVQLAQKIQLEAYSESFLSNAIDWLTRNVQSFPDKLGGVIDIEKARSQVFAEQANNQLWKSINEALTTSIAEGEGRDDWRTRLNDIVGSKPGFDETLARTTIHHAYLAGQNEVLSDPVIGDIFPYRKYFATLDNRVDPDHAAMDGKVYHKDSRLAREADANLHRYNCRCSETAITEDDALAEGISPGGEAPAIPAKATKSEREAIRETTPTDVPVSIEKGNDSLITSIVKGLDVLGG
jgi:SPP1 gp7 family putative phage head morphogenesis protein